MKESSILLGNLRDKYYKCLKQNRVTYSSFLDLKERSMAEKYIAGELKAKAIFWGGYEDAERVMAFFIPMDGELKDLLGDEKPIKVLRLGRGKNSKELGHRDYLGSILAQGIKREKLGDILVNDHGADVVVSADVAEYLLHNYGAAGHTSLTTAIEDVDALQIGDITFKEIRDTVASLRLDNVLSSGFSVSRKSAVEAIKNGLVFVNNEQIMKTDYQVSQGDKLVIRGKGKAILSEIQGKSRKDRTYIVIKRYV